MIGLILAIALSMWSGYQGLYEESKLLAFADSLYHEGEYESALAEYKRFLFLFPASDFAPQVRYRIGSCYQRLGRYSKAIAAYEAFLSLYPASPMAERARLKIGECYLLMGEREEAERRLKKLVDSPAEDVAIRARFLMGLMEVEARRWGEAARWFRSIMEEYPNSDQAILAGQMYDLSREGMKLKRRSGLKAALLSSLLPGAGQVYGGEVERGLRVAAAFGISAVSLAYYSSRGRTLPALTFAFLSGAIYIWNIRDSIETAHKWNARQRARILEAMKKRIEEGAISR